MRTRIVNLLLLVVFAIGLIGSGSLVWNEIMHSNVCPILLGIPAWYIILACFAIPFVMHLRKKGTVIYYAFAGLAFVIALVASIMQFTGSGECPKTEGGTPMCYFSLALFSSIVILKIIHRRYAAKNL
jgi:hypothetical protein